jgi:hypothetical protein
MQQDQFLRAQAAQAQADQAQPLQENQYTQDSNIQNQYMQNPAMQNPAMQNPAMQNPAMQNPAMQNLAMPNQNIQYKNIPTPPWQNQPMQDPNIQNQQMQLQNQRMQTNARTTPQGDREGDFFHSGERYNIHDLYRIIDSKAQRHNAPAPLHRGANAFSRSGGMGYGPHNAPPWRLGPNGRPMIREHHFGTRGDRVEMPDPEEVRRQSREQRERDMAENIDFIEKNPHRLGPTWNPSWKRW